MSKTQAIIDDIRADDREAWQRLWDANNLGHKNDAVSEETWRRLLDPASPVKGLVARLDEHIAGLVHYIIHPVTGHLEPVAYMQDLFVDPSFRRKGIARTLVLHLADLGRRKKWARIYWLAETKNSEAQALYRHMGVKLDFSLYVLPLH
jgi:ribosomal protein S18 acetylase RimI-like enzyme